MTGGGGSVLVGRVLAVELADQSRPCDLVGAGEAALTTLQLLGGEHEGLVGRLREDLELASLLEIEGGDQRLAYRLSRRKQAMVAHEHDALIGHILGKQIALDGV